METRLVLSGSSPSIDLNLHEYHAPGTYPAGLTPSSMGTLPQDNGFTSPVGYVPQQIQTAYGLNQITFNGITGDGTGQTIAIVDAYDDPAFLDSTDPNYSTSDLAQFDAQLGLADPPSFVKYNQNGGTTDLPGTDPAGAGNLMGNWEYEEALDIEWAHAMAPGANIDLVEASNSKSTANAPLFTAIKTAASLPGVSVVSMSWGLDEYSGETSLDSLFQTPANHQGVTFIASAGDSGSPGYYPAYSPNVVAAGGTTLPLDGNGDYPGTGKDGGEVAWSGSGGGISQFETEPMYQDNVQSTGYRTMPDVAWDADPNTGVAVYDSYNDTDNSGPWEEIGGTSVAAPSWSGLLAIVNQGRIIAGGTTLDGPSQTLPALYSLPESDFHDILYGSNNGFNAGPGYDEVTGLGSPDGSVLIPALVSYATADQVVVTGSPPANVIVGDSFGIAVSAEDDFGTVDTSYDGTLTLSLANNPTGATLSGDLTATAQDGVAVFDGLSLDEIGNGYTLQVTSSDFPSVTTSSFNVTANDTPWEGTYYPVAIDSSLRADISAAENNGFADNTIVLSAATYTLTDQSLGQLVIQNPSTSLFKTLTFVGQGETSSIIAPGIMNWTDRDIEILGSSGAGMAVVFQDLAIEGGNATNGGILGGTAALGGALLIDGGTVSLSDVAVSDNQAAGVVGSNGAKGSARQAGGDGGNGDDAQGGGIYLAAGTLTLNGDTFSQDRAKGGVGGKGGTGGGQTTKVKGATGAVGGNGGTGGTAKGGGVYVAGGQLIVAGVVFSQDQAIGGSGGSGGSAGKGAVGFPGGVGGSGGIGNAAYGGAIFLAAGSITVTGTSLQDNSAVGGAGGKGGSGGVGGGALAGSSSSIGSSLFGSSFAIVHRNTVGHNTSKASGSAPGGTGGKGGDGAAASGGGIYVDGGTLSLANDTLDGNQAIGGQGGQGGVGGIGGLGSKTNGSFLPAGFPGGTGGLGGNGASGYGGGLYVAAGTVTVFSTTFSGNSAEGGQGGTGGRGGIGGLAAVFGSGSLGGSNGGGGSGVVLGPGILGGTSSTSLGFGSGSSLDSGGPGGNGGNGGVGQGGGVYVSGGTITFVNDTLADNAAQAGASGSGGKGGGAGTGKVTGGKGSAGAPGSADGGGLYIADGSVSLCNSTVADNTVTTGGTGGGFDVVTGSVLLDSTIVALNTSGTGAGAKASDLVGNVLSTSMYDLIGNGTGLSGITNGRNHNKVGVSDPGLDSLANNGGPTQTIALQTGSPAIAAGNNPESLFADQRGYSVPANTTFDIGSYQTKAVADTTAPTATLQATDVNTSNASSLNPYTFTITYSDNVAISVLTLPGATVQVATSGIAPVSATVVSTTPVGSTDALGDAPEFTVTYQITPPGGSWTSQDNGTYTVTLGGTPITDLTGNSVPAGSVGTFTVSVVTQLVSIAVTPANPSLPAGETQQFTATGTFSDGSTVDETDAVTWASANTSVATISNASGSQGLATGLATGSSTISATLDGISGSTALTVTPAVLLSIAVTPADPSLPAGETQQFTATGTFSDGSTADETDAVTWASADTSVATITTGGLATGVATGTSAIGATLDGISGSTTLTVTPAVLLSIAVTPADPSVPAGETEQFTATGTFSDGSTVDETDAVTWASADTSVATITTGGLATGVATGTSAIGATLDGISGSTTLTVTPAVLLSIAVTPADPSIQVGETQQFTATGTFSDQSTENLTSQVTWASATTSVATITGGGLATAVGTGTSDISATLDGVTGSTVLTVVMSSNDTSTTVTSSVNPSEYDQWVTFTATVSWTRSGSLKPTGTVEFFDGVTELGTGSLNRSGFAIFTTSTLAVGTHSITAEYEGDSNFNGSTSAPLSQKVDQQSTNTRVASSKNPSVYGQPVTFTARVAATIHGTPTGVVTFEDGSTILGIRTLTNGTASFTTSTLAVGTHTITAVYGGDSNFSGSTSAPLFQTVNSDNTTDIRLKSPDNGSVSGQPGATTANVTASLPGSGTPIGIVTFEDGSNANTAQVSRQIVVGSSVQISLGSTESTDWIDQVFGSIQDDSSAEMLVDEVALEQVAFLSRRTRGSTDNT